MCSLRKLCPRICPYILRGHITYKLVEYRTGLYLFRPMLRRWLIFDLLRRQLPGAEGSGEGPLVGSFATNSRNLLPPGVPVTLKTQTR